MGVRWCECARFFILLGISDCVFLGVEFRVSSVSCCRSIVMCIGSPRCKAHLWVVL